MDSFCPVPVCQLAVLRSIITARMLVLCGGEGHAERDERGQAECGAARVHVTSRLRSCHRAEMRAAGRARTTAKQSYLSPRRCVRNFRFSAVSFAAARRDATDRMDRYGAAGWSRRRPYLGATDGCRMPGCIALMHTTRASATREFSSIAVYSAPEAVSRPQLLTAV